MTTNDKQMMAALLMTGLIESGIPFPRTAEGADCLIIALRAMEDVIRAKFPDVNEADIEEARFALRTKLAEDRKQLN